MRKTNKTALKIESTANYISVLAKDIISGKIAVHLISGKARSS